MTKTLSFTAAVVFLDLACVLLSDAPDRMEQAYSLLRKGASRLDCDISGRKPLILELLEGRDTYPPADEEDGE